MTTHVFIVDSTTFKLHLEFLFAGTGAKDNLVDFNNHSDTRLHQKTEDTLVGMIADASRIRKGDLIIFYLQQNYAKKIFEGKFFGIFKAKNDWSFLDNNDEEQYLRDDLEKSLTFRTLIEPYKVYPEGVTEWEALDEIKNMTSPNQMLWSLIYRKLKANRGNTMITVYESERLCQLIRNKNNRDELNCEGKFLSFDPKTQRIVCLDGSLKEYDGRTEEINILPRLIAKLKQRKSFETHLQACMVKSIGKGINPILDNLVLDNGVAEWLGNEVSCGVGMQRIDIMLSVQKNEQRIVIPIELKAVEAKIRDTAQICRYIDWIEQYYIPNRQSDIQPILISKKIDNKNSQGYLEVVKTIQRFNRENRKRSHRLKFIEFFEENDNLVFKEVEY